MWMGSPFAAPAAYGGYAPSYVAPPPPPTVDVEHEPPAPTSETNGDVAAMRRELDERKQVLRESLQPRARRAKKKP